MDNIRIRIPLTVSQRQQTIPLGVQAGGGGTRNYNALSNKPAINGHELVGDQTAAELGLATPEDIPTVPTKTSDLTNDSGFVNAAGAAASAPVQSVNGKTGAVTLDAEDVGALPDSSTLDDIPDGLTYKRPTAAQVQQISTNAADIQTQGGKIDQLQADVDAIEQKIPNQASEQNQLADKDFVNSSINSAAAYFRGAFPTRAALFAVPWQTANPNAENYVSNNDYAYVADDETHNDEAWRYIYVLQPGGTDNGWQPQFRVNESPLTAAQLAALNSGATAALIEQISTNAAAIALKQAIINASGILKGNGNGQVSAAVAGTDYQTPLTAGTDYATPAQVNAKYTKPAGGIPASDMTQAVQASLGKADTALQAVPNTYRTAAQQDVIDQEQSEDISDLKSAIIITKTGVPADFTNNYLAFNGESPTPKLALSKRYFNYEQDKLLSVETTAPYGIYAYGFKGTEYFGVLKESGIFEKFDGSSPILYADKINLSDYADITFKFGLRHNENGTSLNVSTSEAVNIKFNFRPNKELARRKISVIGDSISSFTGYTSPGSPGAYYPLPVARMYYLENMYWKTLADRNDMDVEVIDAYAGSTVADKWQDEIRVPFYDDSRINRLGNPDVIIVEGGINDFGGNPLGDYPALGDYTKTYEFRTGYSLLLNKLKNKYKTATIVCLSMISPRSYNNTTFPEKQTEVKQALATDTTPHAFAEFNESIEYIAKQYQCAYCDITDLLNYYLNPTSSLSPHWYFNLHMDVAYRIEQLLKRIYV